MNFLENLLDGLEVEWKPLGEVHVRAKGTKITTGQMKELHKEGTPVKIFACGKTVVFVDFGAAELFEASKGDGITWERR